METVTSQNRGKESAAGAKAITLEDRSDIAPGLFALRLNLPGEKVNKFSTAFTAEMRDMIAALKGRKDIKSLVVLSDKEGIFIAGADIELIRTVKTAQEGYDLARQAQEVIAGLETLSFPVVAAVNGACLGGGLEFALCCSYIVASDGPGAKLGLPEVNLGVLPGMGGTVRLPTRVGLQTAMDLILSGKQLNGDRALKAGLADAVLPQQDFSRRALEWGARLAKGEKIRRAAPKKNLASKALEDTWAGRLFLFSQARKMVLSRTRGHYPAPLKILDTLQANAGASKKQALEREQKAFGELSATDVSKRLIELFFLTEKVKKQTGVEGYKLKGEDKVSTVGLLGAGVMGGGIAQLAAQKNFAVRMKDIDHKGLGLGMTGARKLFNDLVKKRRMSAKDAELKFNLISPTTTYDGFNKVDVVVEAVVENMDVKKKVLKECEAVLPAHALFASNTSSLSITEMATASARPENVVGMHFFNPVHKMPLIEVIRGEKTSDRATAMIFDLSKKMGKTPIVVKDGPGFLVNRLLMPYLNEAMYLLSEGAPIEELDEAVLDFGMPMGPATLMDEVGLDVGGKVAKILEHAFGERFGACKLNDRFASAKLLGKKGGKGFYLYDERGKKKGLNPEIYGVMGVTPKPPTKEQKADWIPRLILPMVNEAAQCLHEGIVTTADDVDLGMIMGTGFPPFRGGLLRYADSVGIGKIHKDLERLAKTVSPRFKPLPPIAERAKANRSFHS